MTMQLLPNLLLLEFLLFSSLVLSNDSTSRKCASPQFFDLNTTSTIICTFEGDYYALYWYDNVDSESATPFISYDQDNGKRGTGFSSGEFDVLSDGSLVIHSFSLEHEHKFRVLMLAEKYGGSPYIEIVHVYVRVRPPDGYPFITGCDREPVCYRLVEMNSQLCCTVSGARPAVHLKWIIREANIDREISSHTQITQNSSLYSTNVTTTLTAEMFDAISQFVLVCQVNDSSLQFQKHESILLVDYSERDLFSIAPVVKKYVSYKDETLLPCPHWNFTFFLWKKKLPEGDEVVLFCDLFNRIMSKEHIAQGYDVDKKGSLIIRNTGLQHEGSYGCFTGDGLREEYKHYNVSVYVLPIPNYPVVEGCNPDQYCVLEIEQTGTLTCSLHGIRPLVDVEWRVFPKSGSYITFSDKQVKITKNDVTFDISLTIRFRLRDGLQERITAECTTMESDSGLTGLATKLDLIPATINKAVSSIPTTSFYNQDDQNGNTVPIVIVAAIAVIVIMTSLLVYLKVKKRRKPREEPKGTDEEMRPVLNTENEAKFDDFKKQLRHKYERIYKSVQPIPYLGDKIYCVNDLFVKFGMKKLISKGENKESDKWEGLQSYSDMFTITGKGMERILIEGDPGYGKSTLTTQMVYDWCNSWAEWSFKNIDVLILLHLRQLRGDDSIYKAIKSFLLTKDTTLTVTDIECILKEHPSSVCFIFDGFDEYPHYTSKGETDVKNIIQGEMFAESLVIITTRTNILPRNIAPQTVRIRLTGFDDSTRYEYIKKAIVGNDEKASQQIQERLKESPILGDLCEVPLFFAIFAHITHRGEKMEKFTTVTSFFRFTIACFHKHMQNKQIDETEENKGKNDGDEKRYCDLDELAFEGLHGKKQTIVWDKNDLHTRLGEKVYSEYFKIGILVEEEIVEFNIDDLTSEMEPLQNKTKVTFYHKIFCEWYAAKHLAKVAEEGSKDDICKILRQLDCNNLQYVYRFACGISVKAAERIVKFLDESDVSDQFTILCINEQKDMIENIKETVVSLCLNPIIFHASNDAFLQRSITQFLHIASKQKVTIESVWLRNVYQRYESQRSSLLLNHGVALNSLETLRQLHFYEEEKDFTVQEMTDILEFVKTCGELTELWFHLCLLPISLEGSNHLTFKQAAKLKVYWNPSTATKYTLNHSRGVWLDSSGKELTAMEYDRQRKKWLKVRQHSQSKQS